MSRDMSRSRDTIFQSLGFEGLKPRSRHLEVSENGHVSAITNNNFFLTEKNSSTYRTAALCVCKELSTQMEFAGVLW